MLRHKLLPLIVLSGLLMAGVFAIMQVGIAPKLIPKIKLSSFASTQEIADAIFLRLNLELKETPLLIVAFDPREKSDFKFIEEVITLWHPDEDVAVKFIGQWSEGAQKLIIENTTPRKKLIWNLAEDEFSERVKNHKKVLILSDFASGVKAFPQSQIQEYKKRWAIYESQRSPHADGRLFEPKSMTLAIQHIPLRREEESKFEYRCQDTGKEAIQGAYNTPTNPESLGCFILGLARAAYKKNKFDKEFSAMVYQLSEDEFLTLFNKISL